MELRSYVSEISMSVDVNISGARSKETIYRKNFTFRYA